MDGRPPAVKPDCGGLGNAMNVIFGPLFIDKMAVDVDNGPRNTEGVTAAPPLISHHTRYEAILAIRTELNIDIRHMIAP